MKPFLTLALCALCAIHTVAQDVQPALDTQNSQQAQKPVIGIVLGGGGALGFAHIGALKALEEVGIRSEYISGASMGAIIGSLYAFGYSPDEIVRLVEEQEAYKISKIMNFNIFNSTGISNQKKLSQILTNILPTDSFDSLRCFYALSMTDIVNLEPHYVWSGDNLRTHIMASAAIPAVYEPIELNNTVYVDGGVTDNLPIEPLIGRCSAIIMLDVDYHTMDCAEYSKKTLLLRTTAAALKQANLPRIKKANYYVQFPALGNYTMFDFKQFKTIVEIGYNGMKQYLEENPELVQLAQSMQSTATPSAAVAQ
ncbi:MAG: patatin-like phospholipase family protein [Bacteroidales bacterium]|jgi:NTE family protein|nr:patatin-like phospholipase family protein [Bacteroidales bacterium]